MIEIQGDLWELGGIVVVTTNGFVRKDGRAVMGRGCAREAAERFPRLPFELGRKLLTHGNHVFYFDKYELFTFPVKRVWWEPADLGLIRESAEELACQVIEHGIDIRVYLPRPGCGNGGLAWKDVKKIISPILKSSQFCVVTWKNRGSRV